MLMRGQRHGHFNLLIKDYNAKYTKNGETIFPMMNEYISKITRPHKVIPYTKSFMYTLNKCSAVQTKLCCLKRAPF